jgi:hypothetical protein
MFDVNRDKADGSGVSNDLGGEFLELLIFIGDHLGFCKVFHWLRDEAPRNASWIDPTTIIGRRRPTPFLIGRMPTSSRARRA